MYLYFMLSILPHSTNRKIGSTMAKLKRTQTMIYKVLHCRLSFEQLEPHYKIKDRSDVVIKAVNELMLLKRPLNYNAVIQTKN